MRTKNLFIGFVCCVVLQANAQTTNNTIVNENSVWNILSIETTDGHEPFFPRHTMKIYFDGDSTLNGKTYKKVFHCFDDEFCQYPTFEGLIREENQRTYSVFPNKTEEYLLYDFSVEVGDTIKFYTPRVSIEEEEEFRTFFRKVHSIDYVDVNDVLKKKITLTHPNSETITDIWIENIGSLYDFYTIIHMVGYSKVLSCYFQGNELIYKNPEYPNCYYGGREDIPSVQTIAIDDCNIFPNPVDDILHISCLNNAISRVEIFDNLGRQVYSQPYKDKINISSFSKGLYLLKVYDINEQFSVFKIIKN
jgi:hypothetical protein